LTLTIIIVAVDFQYTVASLLGTLPVASSPVELRTRAIQDALRIALNLARPPASSPFAASKEQKKLRDPKRLFDALTACIANEQNPDRRTLERFGRDMRWCLILADIMTVTTSSAPRSRAGGFAEESIVPKNLVFAIMKALGQQPEDPNKEDNYLSKAAAETLSKQMTEAVNNARQAQQEFDPRLQRLEKILEELLAKLTDSDSDSDSGSDSDSDPDNSRLVSGASWLRLSSSVMTRSPSSYRHDASS
jgi:hypothetical protein